MFDGQLTWRTEGTPGSSARTVEVTITPRGGRTRLRLTEWQWSARGRFVAGGVGALAGGSFGSILGFLISVGNPGVAQVLMLAGIVAGVVVFTRAARIMDTEGETAKLEALADRLLAPPAAPPAERGTGTPT